MTFLNELFNGYFQLEAILGIMAVVNMILAILVPIPFLRLAFQFNWLLEQILGFCDSHNFLDRLGKWCEGHRSLIPTALLLVLIRFLS